MNCKELSRLWKLAESRKEAGERPRRDLISGLAYAPPAGDGDNTARAWLTEDEANRLFEIGQMLPRMEREEAKTRIAEKIAKRLKNRSTKL